jgi:large subunit ribosomal protein L18
MNASSRKEQRRRRHLRIRQRIAGTADRPRMAVYVSNRHMYVQFIDDAAARTLASTSNSARVPGCNVATAKQVGALAAQAALEKGIRRVVVDRGGFLYHGRVKQIVEAAVAAGLSVSSQGAAVAEEKQ